MNALESPKCTIGVIYPPGYPCPVVYDLVDEWAEQAEPYMGGGVITQHVKTGRKVPEARLLGSLALLELTPELRAAITEDMAKRGMR